MQVYKGMDIGTAKPSTAEQKKIRHHLLDLVSPRSSFSVYQYRKHALEALNEITRRERVPLVVGGSGLYVSTLWRGNSAPGGRIAAFREKLARLAREKDPHFLHERLKKINPRRAGELHPNDERRIIRALEIAEFSGKPQSRQPSLEDLGFSVRIFGIGRERAELYERINKRVEAMFRKGFVKEVARLRKSGISKTAKQALGYREVLAVIASPPLKQWRAKQSRFEIASSALGPPRNDGAGLIPLIQRNTRHFAKRQLTWFRRMKEIEWIPWKPGEPVAAVCDKILTEVKPWLENGRFS